MESLYRVMHLLGITPWENSRIPRALTKIADGPSHAGIALDLGCGTGAHAVHLAESGWEVIGVDVSRHAIAHARARSTRVDWRVVDLTRETDALDDLAGRVDLLLDVGCLHGLSDIGRQRWAHVARLVATPNARALVGPQHHVDCHFVAALAASPRPSSEHSLAPPGPNSTSGRIQAGTTTGAVRSASCSVLGKS